MTPQERLAAAIRDSWENGNPDIDTNAEAKVILIADPDLAADIELGQEARTLKELQFHPLTGDLDFSYASLKDRLDTLARHHESEGFHRGYAAAKAEDELGTEWRLTEAALPERARYLLAVGEYSSRNYYATAYDMFKGENISADGPTPAAALRALREELEKQNGRST